MTSVQYFFLLQETLTLFKCITYNLDFCSCYKHVRHLREVVSFVCCSMVPLIEPSLLFSLMLLILSKFLNYLVHTGVFMLDLKKNKLYVSIKDMH